jgi:1-acyl-sn-glycerol-3-phosphate acyltransferase
VATIQKAKKQIVDGVSIVMFPEGSRTRNGKLGRFKRGAFQIAIDMKLPIVPITINGSYDVMRVGSCIIRPGKMEMIIHKPIPTEDLTDKDIPALVQHTRDVIYSGLWEKYK